MGKLFGATYYTENDLADEGFKHLGHNVRIARTCTIVGVENISLGDNVRIDGYCTLVAAGSGHLDVGSNVHVGGYCAFLAGEGIAIESFAGVSWGCHLFSRSDDFSGRAMTGPTVPMKYLNVSKGPIRLGRHTVLGAKTVVLPNVQFGEGVAVGAMSLVTKSLDAWGIYSGIPAKRIRDRDRHLLNLEREYLLEGRST